MWAGMPFDSNLSNNGMFKPPSSAEREVTVGGNCLWSPTRINCLAPFTIGTSDEGSVAWVASSIRTIENFLFAIVKWPAPIFVVQSTSALERTSSVIRCSISLISR